MGRVRERRERESLYALIQFFESAMSFYWDPGNMPVLGRVIWPRKGSRKVPICGGMEGEGIIFISEGLCLSVECLSLVQIYSVPESG
jgi:hypothetical protein